MRKGSCLVVLTLVTAFAACGGAQETADAADAEARPDTSLAADAGGAPALACEPTASGADLADRTSPYDSATIRVGGGTAKVCYSRPSLRGRTMIGGEAVPYDTLWRTGANEPTIIHLDTAAEIAGVAVEPGQYSLYTVPRESGPWTLIVNRATSQWGHESRYTPEVRAQEVARTDVDAEILESPVEQLAIRPMDGDAGFFLEWQNTRVTIPVQPAS